MYTKQYFRGAQKTWPEFKEGRYSAVTQITKRSIEEDKKKSGKRGGGR